jgi:hypothetical protein
VAALFARSVWLEVVSSFVSLLSSHGIAQRILIAGMSDVATLRSLIHPQPGREWEGPVNTAIPRRPAAGPGPANGAPRVAGPPGTWSDPSHVRNRTLAVVTIVVVALIMLGAGGAWVVP